MSCHWTPPLPAQVGRISAIACDRWPLGGNVPSFSSFIFLGDFEALKSPRASLPAA